MKAAIFNRFLHTMGGGERHSGMIAQVLVADGHDVDLITHTEVDRDLLADYLGLNLSKVRLRVLPNRGDEAVARISEEYDLFINASYMSRLKPRAKRNIYLCYFPTPFDHDIPRWKAWVIRAVEPLLAGAAPPLELGGGWFDREGTRRVRWMWTNGDAELRLRPGQDRAITFSLGRPGTTSSAELTVLDDDGAELGRFTAPPGAFVECGMDLGSSHNVTGLRFVSEVFRPHGDARVLGVALMDLRASARSGLRERALMHYPGLARAPRDLSFIGFYDTILGNSEYTRHWIKRYWDIDAGVLYPPIGVDQLRPRSKEKRIVVVGRFFAPKYGHCKRQLELVRAFREMVGRGGFEGWRLDVIGGCEEIQEPYLNDVMKAAEGSPVGIHVNAPRPLLEEMLASASIFWTATGFGQSESRKPWTLEHFGMTTVEAMAAGCVPIVIDKAGQREIVRDAVDGYRWRTFAQMEARTREVITDEGLRARLSASAVERAEVFSEDAFADRWHALMRRT